MSYKPDEATLTAYLYGELSEEEKVRVERYLESSPEAEAELNELREVLEVMGQVTDTEVSAPEFVYEESSRVVVPGNQFFNPFMRAVVGIAASIALLMFVGYLTNVRLSAADGGMQISFGPSEKIQTNTFNETDIKTWMNEALVSNNRDLITKINEVESELVQKVDNQRTELKKSYVAQVDKALIDQYVAQLTLENRDIILSLLDLSEQSQRRYMNDLMADFANFMDSQRQSDLDLIQANFNNLVTTTENSQQETNEILASIISTVNNAENQW